MEIYLACRWDVKQQRNSSFRPGDNTAGVLDDVYQGWKFSSLWGFDVSTQHCYHVSDKVDAAELPSANQLLWYANLGQFIETSMT